MERGEQERDNRMKYKVSNEEKDEIDRITWEEHQVGIDTTLNNKKLWAMFDDTHEIVLELKDEDEDPSNRIGCLSKEMCRKCIRQAVIDGHPISRRTIKNYIANIIAQDKHYQRCRDIIPDDGPGRLIICPNDCFEDDFYLTKIDTAFQHCPHKLEHIVFCNPVKHGNL